MTAHQDGCTCGECDGARMRHQALHALIQISDMANEQLATQYEQSTGHRPSMDELSLWVSLHRHVFNILGVTDAEMMDILKCEGRWEETEAGALDRNPGRNTEGT